jgi:hypothetical protein
MSSLTSATKQADVDLVLKLYELRREKDMRIARAWFFTEFNPTSATNIMQMMASSHGSSAHYRMLTSYWDMAASFVLNGGIDEQIFLGANTEHIGVFAKLEPFITEFRVQAQEPDYLMSLETLVRKTPNFHNVMERRRKLFANWTKVALREK